VETHHNEPYIIQLDYLKSDQNTYAELQDKCDREFGRLDGLCHVAGTLGLLAPIEHYAASTWFQVMQTNVTGPFLLTQTLLPLLKQSPKANIVFTGSRRASHGKALFGAYNASKAALNALFQTLADECSSTSIAVNGIVPPPTRSILRAQAYPAELTEHLLCPSVVAPWYSFLLEGKHSHQGIMIEPALEL